MAWKSFWQIRREREAEEQRRRDSVFFPPRPQFPWSIDALSFVELTKRLLPEMRQHHARIVRAASSADGKQWRTEQQYRFGRITVDDLPRLMPVDAATIARWRKRKLFYPHFGQHRTELSRETIYEDFLRTCGTGADWMDDLPTRLKARDKKRRQRKHGDQRPESGAKA